MMMLLFDADADTKAPGGALWEAMRTGSGAGSAAGSAGAGLPEIDEPAFDQTLDPLESDQSAGLPGIDEPSKSSLSASSKRMPSPGMVA